MEEELRHLLSGISSRLDIHENYQVKYQEIALELQYNKRKEKQHTGHIKLQVWFHE